MIKSLKEWEKVEY